MSTFFLGGVSTKGDKAGDTRTAFLNLRGDLPARPGRPQRNVTLRDLNVEQNQALWRTILEIQDAAVAEVPKGPAGIAREGSAGGSRETSDTHSHSTNSNPHSARGGSAASSGIRSASSGKRSLGGAHAQMDAVLFGTDGAHAAAETARRRRFIDRAFEVSKKGAAEPKPVASPPSTMQLSSQPAAASKKLDEAMDGAAGVKGCVWGGCEQGIREGYKGYVDHL